MTDRERWTVYPLLFLTLGIAVKDRIINLSKVDTVLCNTLVVQDRKGKEQVVITSTPAGGLVRTHGTKTGLNALVGHSDKLAGLMFLDASGNLLSGPTVIQTSVTPGASAAEQGAASEEQSAEEAQSQETLDAKAPDEVPKTPTEPQP